MTLGTAIKEALASDDAHALRVMDPKAGDFKTTWDPDNPEEAAQAERVFDEMREKGFAAYSVGKKGERDAILHEFDPEARAIIMAPPIAGG